MVEGDYYDGGSENSAASSPAFYSDDNSYSRSPYDFVANSRQHAPRYDSAGSDDEESDTYLDGRIRIRGDADLQHSDDEIEVGFLQRGGSVNHPVTSGMGLGDGRHPALSVEEARTWRGTKLRNSGRKVVVHPTIHLPKVTAATDETEINSGSNHHGGINHPHYRRRKGSSKKHHPRRDVSMITTSTPNKATPTSYSSKRDRNMTAPLMTSHNADSTRMKTASSSCPKDLMLGRHSLPESPDSGTMGYFTPRLIEEEIDVIPPSTSEGEDSYDILNSPKGGHHRKRRPKQVIGRYHNFETPLLYVPPLSGSSSSLEFNTPAGKSDTKKSPSDHSPKNKVGEEETDSPLSSRTLGLQTTAGLMQTSKYVDCISVTHFRSIGSVCEWRDYSVAPVDTKL